MYTCKQASEMVSNALDRKLMFSEWLNLKMHLSMCRKCRNFSQNIQVIEEILRMNMEEGQGELRLSDTDRKTIRQNLDVIMLSDKQS